MAGEQTSLDYKGYVIEKIPYVGTFDKYESRGFTIDYAFRVVDDFGDPTLPTSQQTFWSPSDAIAAIDLANTIAERVKKNIRAWPTTTQHEFNRWVNYRRRFWRMCQALENIERLCNQAADFDENPGKEVLEEIKKFKAVCGG